MGLSLGSDGYVLININGKRRRVHRIIYEAYYKCRLLDWTILHHKDRNPLNNVIDNLEPIIGFGKHLHSFHRKPKSIPPDRQCIKCGARKSRPNSKGVPNWFRRDGGYVTTMNT